MRIRSLGAVLVRTPLVPSLVWLAARVAVTATTSPDVTAFTFDWHAWFRWDSWHYVTIAASGRTFAPCKPPSTFAWCGNASWLPGYPFILRMVMNLGLRSAPAGVVVSNLATWALLTVVWNGALRSVPRGRAVLLLLLVATFPGAVYWFAIFPVSTSLLGVALSVVAIDRDRPLLAAAALGLASICYPSAAFGVASLALVLALRGTSALDRVRRASWSLVALAPLGAMFVVDQLTLGRWDAFFVLIRQALAAVRAPATPWEGFWQFTITRDSGLQKMAGPVAASWLAAQALVATAIVLACAAAAVRGLRQEGTRSPALYPGLLGLFVWAGVACANTGGAWTRSIALAAPCVLALRTERRTFVLVLLLGAAIAVTTVVSGYFFTKQIV